MDAAEYKHVVLGLIFLKYISDAFEEAYAQLEAQRHEGADPEDADEYRAPGFRKSATLDEVRRHGHVLTPGRYVGAEPRTDDGEPFEEKMARLTAQWRDQQVEAQRLDAVIEENLKSLGFGP